MIICIPDILRPEERETLLSAVVESEFIDGKLTAGFRARRVKNNLQLKKTQQQATELNELIIGALERHPVFQRVAIPKRIHRPLFSRYEEGMSYGQHVDDALMSKPDALRTDLACTVFLSEPTDYDGGELTIKTGTMAQSVKLPCGHAVVYPATTLHRVMPVTRGQRLAAVTWIQSYVREPGHREILIDLGAIRQRLHQQAPEAQETVLADKTYSNLLRLWAET